MQVVGGRTNVWGRQSYPPVRSRLPGRFLRRVRRGLALVVRRPRVLLRPRRGLRRDNGHGRGRSGAAGQPVPAAHGSHLRRDARPQPRQGEARLDGHPRPLGQPHPTAEWPSRVPLLRPVRAGLHHEVLLQLRLHDRDGRPGDGPLHAHPQCDGVQGPDGPGSPQGAGGPLHRPRYARRPRGVRPRGHPLRPGPRVRPHHAQLDDDPGPCRPGQLQRRPRPLPHGPLRGRRCRRGAARGGRARGCRGSGPTHGDLRDPLPQHYGQEAPGFPSRLRIPGRWRLSLPTGTHQASVPS